MKVRRGEARVLGVLWGLTWRGPAVGSAWAVIVGGGIIGLIGGTWCAIFETCSPETPIPMFFFSSIYGIVFVGAPIGLAVGLAAGLLLSIELLFHEEWLYSNRFAWLAGAQVAIGCMVFLPAELFPQDPYGGGGLAFPDPWDSLFQLLVFKLIPAVLAGFYTWRFLMRLK